ncbi:hypothetical protein LTR95_012602, partial [Oleoguttula sp. CCFEE 5521]
MADPADYHYRHQDDDEPTPTNNSSSSPWTFPPPEQHRPNTSRQLSLPRALYGDQSSIFGSGSSSSHRSVSKHRQRPALSIRSATPTDTLDSDSPSHLSSLPNRSAARQYEDEIRATSDRRRLPRVEKDADDPSTPPVSGTGLERQHTATSTTLSRLFAVHAAVSPDVSRSPSYAQPALPYVRQQYNHETAALPEHLYSRGLLGGRHSDITVNAFGKQYKLHRLILDRAPFFSTALSEPWLESNAKDMTVKPDEIDSNITQHAFELALKRLYGCPSMHEEDANAVGLFATGCWLEMVDLIDISIESMLRQMTPETLAPLINLVTRNYYGRAGDKILASAKAMLCRDGWRMPLRYWDGVPADIAREIIGGDGFYIDGEWERWVLSKRVIDRRLRAFAIDAGLHEPSNRRRIIRAPASLATMAIRFDSVSRRSAPAAFSPGMPDAFAKYITLYTHPSIEPLLVLLDEGIHYIHLDFEQLQYIRQAKDVMGVPVMPEKVVSNALWQQMELRQRVMNARDTDLELGIAVQATEDQAGGDRTMSISNPATPPEGKGKQRATDTTSTTAVRDFEDHAVEDDHDSQSWDGTGRPRKFWIPSSDCNIVMGGAAEAIVATPSNSHVNRHTGRFSLVLNAEDVPWASDFATAALPRPGTSDGTTEVPPPAISYTHLPPFRFSAEFPAPRLLKERKRVYSRTVFYAGSLWNIYIQKVASARHTKQLGVYLHRAKERETEEVVYGSSAQIASVEGRIGHLEREMLSSTSRDERRRLRRQTLPNDGTHLADPHEADESSGSAGDIDSALAGASASSSLPEPSSRHHHRKTGQSSIPPPSSSIASDHLFHSDSLASPTTPLSSSSSDSETSSSLPIRSTRPVSQTSTLPPYTDARPTIKTYFKIYSPSRGGRMLSVYESAPDKFNFSQSWGWKSSTLMLEENGFGIGGEVGSMAEGETREVGVLEERDGDAGVERDGGRGGEKGDGRLRFMVVIGNV